MKFVLMDGQGFYRVVSTAKISSVGASISPPLGLLYLGRSLLDEGHKVTVIQSFNEPEKELYQSLHSADAVGISISSKFYHDIIPVIQHIREYDHSIPIIAGGPHCTFHPRKTLQDIPDIDMALEGEGDYAIKDVAQVLAGKKKGNSVPGLYYREKDTIQRGKPHQLVQDLDAIPFPARHLVDKYDYGRVNNSYLFKPKLTSMITSRGCPSACTFCSRHALTYKTFRQRSADNVVQEILEINPQYKSILVVDDNFLADKKRAHCIMDALIAHGNDKELLVMGARVDSAERSLYTKMKQAGVTYIEFGIESGNQDVLDFYKKRTTIKQIKKAVSLSREMNFITTGSFILGAPIETKKHIRNTITFASSLPLDIVLFYPLIYTYGSDLWNKAVDDGLITDTDELSIWADSERGLGAFTHQELQTMCNTAVKRFYLRPQYLIRECLWSTLRKNFRVLKVGMNYF